MGRKLQHDEMCVFFLICSTITKNSENLVCDILCTTDVSGSATWNWNTANTRCCHHNVFCFHLPPWFLIIHV